MSKRRNGFTLVELVVVVMILGILAAVAAPRLLQTSETAIENGAKQTLAVLRDAIDRFAAEHAGNLPGADGLAATFDTDIRPYLRGPFPNCPVGNTNNLVSMTTGTPAVDATTNGWVYSSDTGEIIINSADTDSATPPVAYSTY